MMQEVVELPSVTQTTDIVRIYATLVSPHPRDLLKGMVCFKVQSKEIWSHKTIICQGPKYFKASNFSSSVSRLMFSVGI